MSDLVANFAERHATSTVPKVGELVQAILSKRVSLRSVAEDVPSTDLARTYSRRSSLQESKGHHEIAQEFQLIAQQCAINADNPCTLWLFDGAVASYAVFELLPSRTIAGCLRFDGPFEVTDEARSA